MYRVLSSLPEESSETSFAIAWVYAGLGEVDDFFTFANRAFNEKTLFFGDLRLIQKIILGADKIGEDPRFSEPRVDASSCKSKPAFRNTPAQAMEIRLMFEGMELGCLLGGYQVL